MSSAPVTLAPLRHSDPFPSCSSSLVSAWLASLWNPRFKYRCHSVESCCLPLRHMSFFFLFVFRMCAYTCARLQTPVKGLNMPFHPQEEAVSSEPQHICDWSVILLELYLSLSSPSSPLFHHFSLIFLFILVTQSYSFLALFLAFHVSSSPPLFCANLCPCLSFPMSFLPSLSSNGFAFRIRYPYHDPLITPCLFFSLFILSISTISPSLHIYCHIEGKIREAAMIYVWYNLSIEPHWFPA